MSIKLTESQYQKLIKGENPVPKKTQTKQKGKRNKYHNRKVSQNGIRYDSVAEAERHSLLQKMEQAGLVQNVRYHDRHDLIVLQNDPEIIYEPDFCYSQDGREIVEDVKGFQTKDFILKKKMLIHKMKTEGLDIIFILTKRRNSTSFEVIEKYDLKNT